MKSVGFQLPHTPVAPVSCSIACVVWFETQNPSFTSNPSVHRFQNPQNSNLVSLLSLQMLRTLVQMFPRPRELKLFFWVGVECYIISEKKNERRRGRLEEQAQFGDFPGTISPIFPADTRYLSLSFLSQ